MNRPIAAPIDLLVGPKPDWEIENNDDIEALNSVSESCVILHSLRQSRERWLSFTFPRFSTKSRGKAACQAPPPHTIQTRGKCDLEIGPHIFYDTLFYEVHYLPPQTHVTSPPGYTYQPPGGSWQSKTPYGAYAPPPHTPASAGMPSFELEKTSTPLISSLTAVTTITPALINQVNAAASSNPILANLLQLAAGGKATADQLKTLGLLIQSLATPENTQLVPPSALAAAPIQPPLPAISQAPLPPALPIKEFDLVIEFREAPSERWIFPRGPVTCERVLDPLASYNILITAALPFPKVNELSPVVDQASPVVPEDESPQVVTFCLRRTPSTIWDTVSRWAGNEQKMQENKKILDALPPADQLYLGYRLPQGPFLSQLQTAVAPTYNMKSLKSGAVNASRTKRRVVKQKANASTTHGAVNGEELSSSKRRRVSQPERSAVATQIQCVSCKQTDVPLILGGRFCRPCVDTGHGTPVPQLYKFSSHTPTASDNTLVSITAPETSNDAVLEISTTPSETQ